MLPLTLVDVFNCGLEIDTPPTPFPAPLTPAVAAAKMVQSPVRLVRVMQTVGEDGDFLPFWWVQFLPYFNFDPWILAPQYNYSPRFMLAFGAIQRHMITYPDQITGGCLRAWFREGQAIIDWLENYLPETTIPEQTQDWLIEVLNRWLASPPQLLSLIHQTSFNQRPGRGRWG